ncbi:hypothetical protein HN51_024581 [Arachis hypogaea]
MVPFPLFYVFHQKLKEILLFYEVPLSPTRKHLLSVANTHPCGTLFLCSVNCFIDDALLSHIVDVKVEGFEFGLRRLTFDQDLRDMIRNSHANNNVIHIYFEHDPFEPKFIDIMKLSEDGKLADGRGDNELEVTSVKDASSILSQLYDPNIQEIPLEPNSTMSMPNPHPSPTALDPSFEPDPTTPESNFDPNPTALEPNIQPKPTAKKSKDFSDSTTLMTKSKSDSPTTTDVTTEKKSTTPTINLNPKSIVPNITGPKSTTSKPTATKSTAVKNKVPKFIVPNTSNCEINCTIIEV